MQLLIRQCGTLIDLSPDGHSPLPQDILDLLTPHLQYCHRTFVHGAAQYALDGQRSPVILENRNMYRLEEGRLATGYGFIPKIVHILQQAGHTVHYLDIAPPRARPNCYVPDWDNLYKKFSFRARQPDCLMAMARSLGGIVDATMGFGKTFTMEAFCHLYPHANIAIVVYSKDVAANIVRQLTGKFPNVGFIGGGNKRYGSRITVFTAGSMQYSTGDYDFLLCDEVHQLMTDTFSRKLGENFRFTRNFGFSGSVGDRLDGADAKLEMFFGPVLFRMSYQEAVDLGLVVPIRVNWIPVDASNGNPARNKTGVPRLRWGIWRNDYRNQCFAQHVRTNVGEQDQVLMAVATFEHAVHMWRQLPEFQLCYSNIEDEELDRYIRSGLLPAGFQRMTAERRDAMRCAFEAGTLKRVIATDVWSTGVSFNSLQWLYRLDARESKILSSQWPARTSRLNDGKEYGTVVDAIDIFDYNFKRKSEARRRHYQSHGWTDDWQQVQRTIHRV